MNERAIHTHLYSKIANEVLRSVEGQLSDGLYESSPSMEKYWLFSSIDTSPDGEVLIKVSTDRYDTKWRGNGRTVVNGLIDMSDDEIRKWFAGKIKHIMQTELKDDPQYYSYCGRTKWLRTNDQFETSYLSYNEKITVSDVYFVYDFLLGRDTARKYSVKQHMQIEGTPASEAEIKAETEKREKILVIDAKMNADLKALEAWKTTQIDIIEKEYDQKRSAIYNEWRNAKATV